MQLSQPTSNSWRPLRSKQHLCLVAAAKTLTGRASRRSRAERRVGEPSAPLLALVGQPVPASERGQRTVTQGGRRSWGIRSIAPEHVERFLNRLSGEALLVGALAYDVGVRLSQLRFLRVRDVNLSTREIVLSDGVRRIPEALFEDLRDHISDKVCGEVLAVKTGRRDQLLFEAGAFEVVLQECSLFFQEHGRSEVGSFEHPRRRRRDSLLRVMGWFHAKRAGGRGRAISSPLALFDKGPRIVRRDRSGSIHAYYLWRAVYSG